MKLTKETLKQIIKEELEAVISEAPAGVGQKTNVGSSRTQAYGDQTLGKTAAGQAAARQSAIKSRQQISHAANQRAIAELDRLNLETRTKRLASAAAEDVLIFLNEDWPMWKQVVKEWESSKKDQTAYNTTILKALNMIDDGFITSRLKKTGAAKFKSKTINQAVARVIKGWEAQMEKEYEAQIGTAKKKSFLQRLNPFSEE